MPGPTPPPRTEGSPWSVAFRWAQSVALHPPGEAMPALSEIQGCFATLIAGLPGDMERARLRQRELLQATDARSFAQALLRFNGMEEAAYLNQVLPPEWVAFLQGHLRASVSQHHRTTLDAHPAASPVGRSRKITFFDTGDPSDIFSDRLTLTLHPRGVPSSDWQRIVEAADREQVAIHFVNRRARTNAVYIPGESNLATLMLFVVQALDPIEIVFRGKARADLAQAFARLSEVISQVLARRLAWRRTQAAFHYVEGVANTVLHESLPARYLDHLCQRLEEEGSGTASLETADGHQAMLKLGPSSLTHNQTALTHFCLRPETRFKVFASSANAKNICSLIVRTYLGEHPQWRYGERGLAYTLSTPKNPTLALELWDLYEDTKEKSGPVGEMVALVDMDSAEVLLYRHDGQTSAQDMLGVWRYTSGKKRNVVEARLILSNRSFLVSPDGLNTKMEDADLEQAGRFLMWHLLGRRAAVEILEPNPRQPTPRGTKFRFRLDEVQPLAEALSEAETSRRLEGVAQVRPTAPPPPAPPASLLPPAALRPDPTSPPAALLWSDLEALVTSRDKRLIYGSSPDLRKLWGITKDLPTSTSAVPFLFFYDTRWMTLAKAPLPGSARVVAVDHDLWKRLIHLVPQLTSHDRRKIFLCNVSQKNGLFVIELRFENLAVAPVGRWDKRGILSAMRTFLKAQGITFNERTFSDRAIFAQTPAA